MTSKKIITMLLTTAMLITAIPATALTPPPLCDECRAQVWEWFSHEWGGAWCEDCRQVECVDCRCHEYIAPEFDEWGNPVNDYDVIYNPDGEDIKPINEEIGDNKETIEILRIFICITEIFHNKYKGLNSFTLTGFQKYEQWIECRVVEFRKCK